MRLCVFCGASPGRDPGYLALARSVGGGLADARYRRRLRRRTGRADGRGRGRGARGGRRGHRRHPAAARRSRARPPGPDGAATSSTPSTSARRCMAELADGFIALPGGLGTLEELPRSRRGPSSTSTPSRSGCSAPAATGTGCSGWLDRGRGRGFIAPTASRRSSRVDPDLDALLDRFDALAAAGVALGGPARRPDARLTVGGRLRGLRRLRRRPAGSAACPERGKSVAAIARIVLRSGSCDAP